MMPRRIKSFAVRVAIGSLCALAANADPIRVDIASTLDGAEQAVHIFPARAPSPRPLLVVLHPWSANLERFDGAVWEGAAIGEDWHLLFPDFRGANHRPEACGSMLARQDILDAVDFAIDRYAIDESRIYLAGVSGGGHMTLVMAAHAPERWTAVSAWAGISDLTAWHAETKAAGRKYYRDIEAVVGGPPGSSESVDKELKLRSPVHHLARAKYVPIDIATGIYDGHTGSVPIHQSIDAFNTIAEALGEPVVSQERIARLSSKEYTEPALFEDETYNRGIHFRRDAGHSRITIFEGGHEGIPEAAVAWFASHTGVER